MDVQMESELGRQLKRVMETAANGHAQGLAFLNSELGSNIQVNFNGIPARAVQLLARRRQLAPSLTFNTLIRRRVQALQSEVDLFTASVVTRGVSAGRATIELAAIIAGDDPKMISALNLLSRGRIQAGQIQQALDGLPMNYTDQFANLKSLLSDIRRIVVSETNNAFNEANRLAALRSPAVAYLKWRVSSRHFGLRSSPDICTIYLTQDFYGLGDGVYFIQSVPPLPHPNCGCGVDEVLSDPKDLFKPKPTPTAPTLLDSSYVDRIMTEYPGETENHVIKELQRANELVKYSFDTWKESV